MWAWFCHTHVPDWKRSWSLWLPYSHPYSLNWVPVVCNLKTSALRPAHPFDWKIHQAKLPSTKSKGGALREGHEWVVSKKGIKYGGSWGFAQQQKSFWGHAKVGPRCFFGESCTRSFFKEYGVKQAWVAKSEAPSWVCEKNSDFQSPKIKKKTHKSLFCQKFHFRKNNDVLKMSDVAFLPRSAWCWGGEHPRPPAAQGSHQKKTQGFTPGRRPMPCPTSLHLGSHQQFLCQIGDGFFWGVWIHVRG